MKVFAAEREAGLAATLKGPGRLLMTAALRPGPPAPIPARAVAAACRFAGKADGSIGDPDLFPLNSVLVSTGWNLNHAVFVPEELVAARHTPEDKPFNYGHDEADVIGHITSVTARDRDGTEIPADAAAEDYPADFDLHTSAVLYRIWQDEKLQERMDKIVAGIPKGEWFVSMECLYRDFDYALLEEDGTQKVVARNKATAFLTKHLKAFGGDGTYEGAKLGQVLKAYVFSGKGLTDQPANPGSVISPYAAAARFYTSCAAAGYQPVTGPTVEPLMEELKKQLAEAQAAKADADKAVATEKARADAAEKAKADADKAKADAEAALAKAQAALAKAQADLTGEAEKVKAGEAALTAEKAKVTDLEKAKADADKAKADADKALAETGLELKKVTRTQAALAKGLSAEKAKVLVDNQLDLPDDKWAASLAVYEPAKETKAPLPERETASADPAVLPDGKGKTGVVTPPATGASTSASKGLAAGILGRTAMKKTTKTPGQE